MGTTQPSGDFAGGDPVSRILIDLASDRQLELRGHIPAGLVELAQRHGLVQLAADVTEGFLVRAVAARETARRRVLDEHMRRILGRLHETGIRTTVLKGPAIAARYRDPLHRPYSDIDLLVQPTQVDSALEVLAADDSMVEIPLKRPKADKRDVLFEDESGVRFNIDLHWDLFSYSQLRDSAKGATDEAWSRSSESIDSVFGPMWELPEAYRIPFLCCHAVLDHRFRLILFRDLLEIGRGDVDWDAVELVSRRWGLRSTTHLALWITREALGAPIPEDFISSIRPRSVATSYLEWALPRTDLIRFNGHRPHPINLAAVMLHDSAMHRAALLVRAPAAFPRWRRKVAEEGMLGGVPRVLILVSTNRRRGAEVFTERLRDGLIAIGWVVEAISLKGIDEEPRADIQPLTAGGERGGRFDVETWRRLRNKVRSFRPDIVIANGGTTLRYAAADSLLDDYQLVYIGIGEPKYWLRSRFSRWANRVMLRRADRVFAVSDETRLQLLELEPSLSGRVITTHTGVPSALFDARPSFSDGPLHVVMVGSLTPEKDPMKALRSVAAIEGARLRFVGDGPLADDLRALASKLRATDRIEFAGSVSNVRPHLEWAHVLILTSLSEGLPGAILEAGAAGVPTVAVDVGGVKEAVEDGVSGFVTSLDDSALIDALMKLDGDRELLADMGEAARRLVRSRFALDDVIERYASALREVNSE